MANEPSWDDIFSPRPAEPAPAAPAAAFPLADGSATPTEAAPPAAPVWGTEPVFGAPVEAMPAAPMPAAPLPAVAFDPLPAYPSAAPDYFEAAGMPAAPVPAAAPVAPTTPALDPNPFASLFAEEATAEAATATWPTAATPAPAAPPIVTSEPQYAAPQYEASPAPAPQYEAPQYVAPQYEASQYAAPPAPAQPSAAPQYVAPQYEAPQYAAPPAPAQPSAAPQYEAPQYTAPQYEAPQYTAAQYNAAQYDATPAAMPEAAPSAAWPVADPAPSWSLTPDATAMAAPGAATPLSADATPAVFPEVAWNTPALDEPPVAARSLPEWPAEPVEEYPPTAVYPVAEAAPQPADSLAAFEGLFAAPADPPTPADVPTPALASASPASPTAAGFSPDDPFGGLFGNPMGTPAAPDSRGFGGGGDDGAGSSGGGRGRDGDGTPPKRKRSLKWLAITLPIVIVLGLVGGGAAFAWLNYEDQVRELLGWELPNDYEGTGNGEEVVVTIQAGDIGSDVANTLHDAGVTMTFDAFYDLLLEQAENVNFLPGNYSLQKEMSAQAALDALLDPANKITSRLLITEGTVLSSALQIIAETTGIPLEEVQAAAADPTVYGVPANAPSLEGYLFPATYDLDGTETAADIFQRLVDETFARLDALGVAPENRHEVLTKAGLVQREAGPNEDDFYKIARVFQNRLDQGMNLQSDATVAYGTGNLQTVWTTDAERADASNPYNTYANPGLPIGPIGAPGEVAMRAVLAPADGPWLFFVPINLATGETVFSETADEHEAAVEQLRAWCRASDENASYCE